MQTVRDCRSVLPSSDAGTRILQLSLYPGGSERRAGCTRSCSPIVETDLARNGWEGVTRWADSAFGPASTAIALRPAGGRGLGPAVAGSGSSDVFVVAGDDFRGGPVWSHAVGSSGVARGQRGSEVGGASFLATFRSNFTHSAAPACHLQTGTSDTSGNDGLRPCLHLPQCLMHQPIARETSSKFFGRLRPSQWTIQPTLHPVRGASSSGRERVAGNPATGPSRSKSSTRTQTRCVWWMALAGGRTRPWLGQWSTGTSNRTKKERTHGDSYNHDDHRSDHGDRCSG